LFSATSTSLDLSASARPCNNCLREIFPLHPTCTIYRYPPLNTTSFNTKFAITRFGS
jgi:hypothetical protein